MKRVHITPNPNYFPSALRALLVEIGVSLIMPGEDGTIVSMMNDHQIGLFRLRATAHKLVVEEPEPTPVIETRATPANPEIARLQEQIDALREANEELRERLETKTRPTRMKGPEILTA